MSELQRKGESLYKKKKHKLISSYKIPNPISSTKNPSHQEIKREKEQKVCWNLKEKLLPQKRDRENNQLFTPHYGDNTSFSLPFFSTISSIFLIPLLYFLSQKLAFKDYYTTQKTLVATSVKTTLKTLAKPEHLLVFES